MNSPRDSISLSALEQALAEVEPGALLVPSRILRRVIKQHSHLTGLGLRVPHRKVYILHREALLAIVARSELDIAESHELPELVILINRPSLERLSSIPASAALTLVWRLLFHAKLHLAMEQRITEHKLTPADIRSRIAEIGRCQFEEIRSVLTGEDLLLPPADDRVAYTEFVAVYMELKYFASKFLQSYFPSIEDYDRIDKVLSRDISAERIYADTKLAGTLDAPDPTDALLHDAGIVPAKGPRAAQKLTQRIWQRLARIAEKLVPLGNSVRSSILRYQAASHIKGEAGKRARNDALVDIRSLAKRLQAAIGFTDSEEAEWQEALCSLVGEFSDNGWSPGVRMLYDLQKGCIDHERGVLALDVWSWLKNRCRGSVKRPLPGQREVLISKHLRTAAERLPSVPLTGRDRLRLSSLMQSALHRTESRLRVYFRPLIDSAFDQVSLTPNNLPEKVARQKLVDELIDIIAERGFLGMSDLRDAISRNNLKLPDITGLKELRYGDQVLQVDRQLAPRLDGVYRKGEIYLRLPQQISSLAFGTQLGRFLTQFVAIPFGGAYVVLEFVQHIVNGIRGHSNKTHTFADGTTLELPTLPSTPGDQGIHLTAFPIVFTLGLFLLALFQHLPFRHACLQFLLLVGRGLRKLFYDWPAQLLRQPWVQRVVHSWPFKVLIQYLVKPGFLTALLLGLSALITRRLPLPQTSAGIFVIANLLVNSRLGRTVDELVTDWIVTAWHRFRIHIVAAVLRFIMDVFQRLIEGVERVLYAVDEWLRFRTGENRITTGIKVMLTLIWSVVNYVVRFFVNVLIEPQINPIKHFPVVTVGHKMILPLAFTTSMSGVASPLASMLLNVFPLSIQDANTWCVFVVWLIPGAFGFVVWELKENWRLYAANRPPSLQAVSIGHHGETMLQFMRPGFRSGTLPKLFARLRRANRRAYWSGNWRNSAKQLHAIHAVEEAVRRFSDRELAALLEASRGWGEASLATGEIRLGINRIAIELYSPDRGEDSLWLGFENHAGWLVASVEHRGWLDRLSEHTSDTVANALAGFYKMSGVDIVKEEIEARLDLHDFNYEITSEGLFAWDRGADRPRLLCRLHHPSAADVGEAEAKLSASTDPSDVTCRNLFYSERPLLWARWVAVWEQDQLADQRPAEIGQARDLLRLS